MKRSAKNFVRLVALALAMLMLSSCTGCSFANLFDIFISEETDENGNPIVPDSDLEFGNTKETGAGYVKNIDQKEYTEWKDVISALEEATKQEILGKYKSLVLPSLLGQNGPKDPKLDMQIHGVIGDSYVVYAKPEHGSVYWEKIGDLEFRYTKHKPMLYKNDEFISLADAFTQGLISEDELAKAHKSYVEANYAQYYKQSSTATADDSLALEYVTIYIQPGYNNKAYTVEDFADVGATKIEVNESAIEKEPTKIGRKVKIYLNVDSKEDIVSVIKTLENRDDVFYAEPVYLNEWGMRPNDEEYLAWQWAVKQIKMSAAWDIQPNAAGVNVGVIDTGFVRHEDYLSNMDFSLSESFDAAATDPFDDDEGHGTKVAGIIGAVANNEIGIAGVCSEVNLISLKADATVNAFIEAIRYATLHDIDIVNYSAGGVRSFNQEEYDAIEDYPGLLVCIAGNDNRNLDGTFEDGKSYYPANYDLDNIIVVGATAYAQDEEDEDQKAWFSGYGETKVDLFAPGEGVRTTIIDDNAISTSYNSVTGTSFAAPLVTGVAALVLAQNPTYTPAQIKAKILNSVDEIDALSDYCASGGRLNAAKALHIHDYTYSYSLYSSVFHRAYCECGEYINQRHTHSTRCTKCSYGGGLVPTPGLSKNDEEETE